MKTRKINQSINQSIRCFNTFFEDAVQDLLQFEFDYIVCASLLHEVENPSYFLEKLYGLTVKDKTIVHINVPNMNSFHRLLAKESGLIKEVNDKSENNIKLQQTTNFTLESLSALVKKAGFTIVDKGSYFIKPFTHKQMQQLLDAHIIEPAVLEGLYKMEKYMCGLGSEIFVEIKK